MVIYYIAFCRLRHRPSRANERESEKATHPLHKKKNYKFWACTVLRFVLLGRDYNEPNKNKLQKVLKRRHEK